MLMSGRSMTFTLNIPDQVNSFQIPIDINWVILKNVGTKPLEFQFDDDGQNDSWRLEINEQVGPIRVKGGTNFNTDGIGGDTILKGIAWGWKLKKLERL